MTKDGVYKVVVGKSSFQWISETIIHDGSSGFLGSTIATIAIVSLVIASNPRRRLATSGSSNALTDVFDSREYTFASGQNSISSSHHRRLGSERDSSSNRRNAFGEPVNNSGSITSCDSFPNALAYLKNTSRYCSRH
jgi:hypothetical protein